MKKPINQSRTRFSVSARITLGFALVLVLHVSIAVVAHIGQKKAAADLKTHNDLRNELITVAQLDTAVRELERGVLLFVQTGHSSAADRITEQHAMIEDRLELLEESQSNADAEKRLRKMQDHLTRHRELFEAVTLDRGRRDKLYETTLLPAYDQSSELLLSLAGTQIPTVELAAYKCLALMREAHAGTLSFLRTPDSELVSLAKNRLETIRAELERLDHFESDSGESVSRQLNDTLDRYDKGLIEVVQATRAYLYLVNVAMAGEAAEFLYLSGEIRVSRTNSIEYLTSVMEDDHRQFSYISNVIAIGTILLGIVAGAWICRTIAPPLKEITSTLKDLAAGRKTPEIPFSTRPDEIGELSAAAQIFRRRSEQKEELLEQARASEERLRQNELILSRRNAELDEFTYVASHDLQEPLRKLMSFSELLPMDLNCELTKDAARDLEFITDAARRMHVLVGDLLILSRSGRTEIQKRPIELDVCVDEAMSAVSARVDEAGAEIERDALPTVSCDKRLVTQLYQNLVSNALKFVKPDVTPMIHLTVEEADGEIVFGVRDNGIGIKPDYLQIIFSPFKRLHGRSEYEGSGIGLSICRKAVERHGGKIWVESEYGQGSHFKFTLGDTANVDVSPEDVSDEQLCLSPVTA